MTALNLNELYIPRGGGEETASGMTIIARSRALGGDVSIMQGFLEPGALLPPHTHENEDQAVFLIEGELEFEIGGRDGLRFTARAGDYVLKSRGISHGFWNATDIKVRYIELSGRDGFERFIDARQGGIHRMVQTAESELDMEMHTARIPELMLRHRLTRLAGVNMGGA
ncbi:MAG: cupin domain-containing protein [Proteobacteria bacterium]|nr:cupin domain-containing protein [Pseudomonadota bacterium]MCP4922259.1 cupin domain-containing protein [Pseudomonadota bacterium]